LDIDGIITTFDAVIGNAGSFRASVIPPTPYEALDAVDCVFGVGHGLPLCQLTD
jgi:hypothetical protein